MIFKGAVSGALLALVLAHSAWGQTRMAQNDKPPPNTMGDVLNNQGIITQGQHGNNTLNVGPRYAVIGDETIEGMKNLIPASSEVHITRAIQDGPTLETAVRL